MAKLSGVITYTIGRNGCLNGFYANDASPSAGEVFNEIAKKIEAGKEEGNGGDDIAKNSRGLVWDIVGDYICSWVEKDTKGGLIITNGRLSIKPNGNNSYLLEWKIPTQSKPLFTGTGFLTEDNQLTVRYND